METTLNIDSSTKYGICSQKCAYNFKYPETYLKIKNQFSMRLILEPQNRVDGSVKFNNIDCTLDKFSLILSSAVTFNGKNSDASLILQHSSSTGGNRLLVTVPIKHSDSSSGDLSDILNDPALDTYKNEANRNTVLNYNHNFSLQDIIPIKPFYTLTYDNNQTNIIIFDMLNAISLNVDKLKQIINKSGSNIPQQTIYYNEKGPNLTDLSDGIYISCKPTGESQELVDITKPKNNVTFGEYNNSLMVFVKIVIGILLLIFVFFIISSFLKLVAPKLSNTISGATTNVLTK